MPINKIKILHKKETSLKVQRLGLLFVLKVKKLNQLIYKKKTNAQKVEINVPKKKKTAEVNYKNS